MKETTKQRKLDELAAQLLGITVEEVQKIRGYEDQKEKTQEAQAILLFLEQPRAFISKECDECGRIFLTTYKFVSLCSNRCRIKSLERIGIIWNPTHTAEERWRRARIPIYYVMPPEALEVLMQIAQQHAARPSNPQQLSSVSQIT